MNSDSLILVGFEVEIYWVLGYNGKDYRYYGGLKCIILLSWKMR